MLFWFALLMMTANATIYGDFSLRETADLPSEKQTLSRAVAVQVKKFKFFTERQDSALDIMTSTLREKSLCEHEPFLDQPIIGTCSGFLITNRLLLTAGHCVPSTETCQETSWVFDFVADQNSSDRLPHLTRSQVYNCQQVIARSYNSEVDFALIELDRPVRDRSPLPLQFGAVRKGAEVFAISHPLGLPQKYSSGIVRSTSEQHIVHTTDLMRGSSGAPLFDRETMQVVGIVVRGDVDYFGEKDCNEFKRCGSEECRGETAQTLASIADHLLPYVSHIAFLSLQR